MGCQFEVHGSSLNAIQDKYSTKGVYVCGLNRIEHPYDVEDHLRHFGTKIPMFVDLKAQTNGRCFAPLGSVMILDSNHNKINRNGKTFYDPDEVQDILNDLLPKGKKSAKGNPSIPIFEEEGKKSQKNRPVVEAKRWSKARRLGCGGYPKIISFAEKQALCAWVSGSVPNQHIEYSFFNGRTWGKPAQIPLGEDAHAPSLDVDMKGIPVLVWSQKESGVYRISMSRFQESKWSTPKAVTKAENNSFRPNVFCLPSGNMYVTWYSWKTVKLRSYPKAWWRSVFVTRIKNGSVGTPLEITELKRGSDDCWDPILSGAEGNLRVSWLRDENPPKLFCSSSGKEKWSPQKALVALKKELNKKYRFHASSPIQGIRKRCGLAFEVFAAPETPFFREGWHVYFYSEASEGSKPEALSAVPGRHFSPVGVETDDGKYCFFWWHAETGNSTIRFLKRDVNNWTNMKRGVLVEGKCDNLYPSAWPGQDGAIWLAWQVDRGASPSEVYVSCCAPKKSR